METRDTENPNADQAMTDSSKGGHTKTETERLDHLTPTRHVVRIEPGLGEEQPGVNRPRNWIVTPSLLYIKSRDVVRFVGPADETVWLFFRDKNLVPSGDPGEEPFGQNPVGFRGYIDLASMLPPLDPDQTRRYAYTVFLQNANDLADGSQPVVIVKD